MRISHLQPHPSPAARPIRFCCSSNTTPVLPAIARRPSPARQRPAGVRARDLRRARSGTVRLTRGGIMHGVIRRYRVRLGTVAQAARYTEKGFLPILRGIPGFVSSHLLDEGNDVLTWMALLETEEAAQAAVRASRDWFRDEWSSFRPLPPEVLTGEVLARATADRRRTVDRRRLALVGATAWDGPERRAGSDRRLEAPSWAPAGCPPPAGA